MEKKNRLVRIFMQDSQSGESGLGSGLQPEVLSPENTAHSTEVQTQASMEKKKSFKEMRELSASCSYQYNIEALPRWTTDFILP